MSNIVTIPMSCGLTLVAERIPAVASVAVAWLLPAGSATDPDDADGLAAMLCEAIFRGAGGMSSREIAGALHRLGVQRAGHVSTHHLHVEATLLGRRLEEAMPLLSAIVREPALDDADLGPVRELCLQSLAALDDDPPSLATLRLRERHLPAPFGRHGYGTRDVLERVTMEEVRAAWRRRFTPAGSILAIAGACDPPRIARQLETLLDGWEGAAPEVAETAPPPRGYADFAHETAQVHIALAYDAPAEPDRTSMLERLATTALGGSTSGRLFTEVRQKRSLCYSVSATYRALRDRGFVSLYAGTTTQRAQETLDVCMAEIERLREGLAADEFARAATSLKSSLVMQGESTPARANALASDHFRRGRARSLDEVAAAVDAVTLDAVNAYLAARDAGPFTVVTVGSAELTPAGV
jgi:predicted Zn-dependent peptidase